MEKRRKPEVNTVLWEKNLGWKTWKTQGTIEFAKSQWFELIQSIQHVRIEVLVMGQVSF